MEILKQGDIKHRGPIYIFSCERCEGIFKAHKSECKIESNSRNGIVFSRKCPTSGCGCTVLFMDHLQRSGVNNMYESVNNLVSHPAHYQSKVGLEVIDVIEAFTLDLKGIEATDTGNIIKYACRWKKKNGIQDLEKIMWYAQHLIDYLKKIEKENI